jgi:AraC-like DNA-binding protein
MKPVITHVGQYTRAENHLQETEFCHIGLCLSGLDYMTFSAAGQTAVMELSGSEIPCFMLLPPGVRIDFRFGHRRENWVIQCHIAGLELDADELQGRFLCGNALLSVPFVQPLGPERALELRERFRRIHGLWTSSTPANLLAAGLMSAGILGEMMAEKPSESIGHGKHLAMRFRALIDADTGFRKTLAELSRETGAAPGYLRKCFYTAYRIEPGEYRARRRLGRILELIGRDRLGFKEIAESVGMKHVTHLNAFVGERCGVTPGALRKSRRSV